MLVLFNKKYNIVWSQHRKKHSKKYFILLKMLMLLIIGLKTVYYKVSYFGSDNFASQALISIAVN